MARAARNLALARARFEASRFAEAARFARRAVAVLGRARDATSTELRVAALCALGSSERMRDRRGLARRALLRAVEIAEGIAERDAALVEPLTALGILHKHEARYDDAHAAYRRALRIARRTAAAGEQVAALLHNLGGLEHARGRFARGEPFARAAATLRAELLGPSHPRVAADLAALASIVAGRGRLEEAEQLYTRALAIFTRAYGAAHYEVAVTLNDLAALADERADFARAARLYRRALRIKCRLFGHAHLEVAITANNLAVTERHRGRMKEARVLYAEALPIFTRALGHAHPHTVACRRNAELLAG